MLSKLWAWINKIDPNHKWLLILIGALTMMFFWISKNMPNPHDKNYQTQIAAYQDTTKVLLDQNKNVEKANLLLKAAADSLQKISVDKEKQLTTTIKNATVAKKIADSKIAQLQQENAFCENVCADWKNTALNEQKVSDSLKKATQDDSTAFAAQITSFGKLTAAYDNRGVEIRNLSSQLQKVPVYKPEKILWIIPLPSRKASFIAGGIIGLLGGLKVSGKI